MKKMFLILFLVSLTISARAQIDRVVELDPVEIRARKSTMQHITNATITIDSNILANSRSSTLGELLMQNSPINIKYYGRGDVQTATFRGTSPSHTMVYWNGMRLNSPMQGAVDFSLIPVYMIDNLTVDPGLSSMGSGSGALGGSVRIENSVDWNNTFAVEAAASAGSFETYNAYVNLKVGNHKIQSSTRLYYNYSLNNFEFINRDIIDPTRPDHREKVRQKNADYHRSGVMQELAFRLGENQSLSAVVWALDSKRNLPQLTTYEGGEGSNLTNRQDASLNATLTYKTFSEKLHLTARVGASLQRMGFTQTNRTAIGSQQTIDASGHSRSLTANVDIALLISKKHTIWLQTQYMLDMVSSREQIKQVGFDKHRSEASQMVSLQSDWNRHLSSTLSVRVGICGDKLYGAPMAGVEYNISKHWALKARLGYNLHYPTISDLYYVPGGNPDLRPEQGLTAELGVVARIKGFRADLNFFDSQIRDWIVWLPSHQQFWTPQNLRSVRARGIEFIGAQRWQFEKLTLEVSANFTLNHTINNSSDPAVEGDESRGRQLVYVPLISGGLFARADLNRWSLSYQLWGEGEKYASTSANPDVLSTIEPYLLHSLTLGYEWRWMNVSLCCENIFNSQFYTVLRRPMPGRSFTLTLRVKI